MERSHYRESEAREESADEGPWGSGCCLVSPPKTSQVICDREQGEGNTKGPPPAHLSPLTHDRLIV